MKICLFSWSTYAGDFASVLSDKNLVRLLLKTVLKQKPHTDIQCGSCLESLFDLVFEDIELNKRTDFDEYEKPLTLGEYAVEIGNGFFKLSLGEYTGTDRKNVQAKETLLREQVHDLGKTALSFFTDLAYDDSLKKQVGYKTLTYKYSLKNSDPVMARVLVFPLDTDFALKGLMRLALIHKLRVVPFLRFLIKNHTYGAAALLRNDFSFAASIKPFSKQTHQQLVTQLSALPYTSWVRLTTIDQVLVDSFIIWAIMVTMLDVTDFVDPPGIYKGLGDHLKRQGEPWCLSDRFTYYLETVDAVYKPALKFLYQHHYAKILAAAFYRDAGLVIRMRNLFSDYTHLGIADKILHNTENLDNEQYRLFLLALLHVDPKAETHGDDVHSARSKLFPLLTLKDFNDPVVCRVVIDYMEDVPKERFDQAAVDFLAIPDMAKAFKGLVPFPHSLKIYLEDSLFTVELGDFLNR